ncbi:hypothetical protein INT48_005773 [Thamnidium elegans]|uniref:Histone-lysine N-methyltransferase n=1 Tax=Thamnidium elegans TaxID=101142 RepID=A0A8H7SWH0_9FUNG|nr:hypothetical protein INT48_005773 [Thamnidium elegans]
MSIENESKDLAEDEYIVSRVAGRKNDSETGRRYYLIEWEGYDLKDNTWEEESNVYSSSAIDNFLTAMKKQMRGKVTSLATTKKKLLLRNTFDPDTGNYYPNTTAAQKTSRIEANKRTREFIETETESVTVSKPIKEARVGIEKLSLNSLTDFEAKVEQIKKSIKVQYPLVRLSNNLMHNKQPVYEFENLKSKVLVVNEVDNELPSNFIYIDELVYTDPVQPPDSNFLFSCNCSPSADCSHACHDFHTYDKSGRLLLSQGTAIYECNQTCECSTKCRNRVVQKGRSIPLQVYKTKAKGWGVRSNQSIPKGTFVEEYIGEVIQVKEGDQRGHFYDKIGCSYLFDMDFAQSEFATKYVIDSFILGNVSRFFNHSCTPNLAVFAVFHDSADNQMHRLAFFASRDIAKGEELCFDYNGRGDGSLVEPADGAARYECHCSSPECRKWIYH